MECTKIQPGDILYIGKPLYGHYMEIDSPAAYISFS